MTETLSKPQSQEITQSLMFERFDDAGSGIAVLEDGRYMIEVGTYPSGLDNSEGSTQRYDLALAIKFIDQEPDISTWYGYQYIPPQEGGLARIVIPNPDQLNARKNSLPSEIGVNRGTFKAQEGGRFGAVEYLGMLGRGEIPIATEANEKAHDLCGHTAGFAVMSAELFNFMSATASDALSRNDYFAEKHRGDVTRMIDQVSGGLTSNTSQVVGTYISMMHSLPMPRDEMHKLISSLQEAQQRTIEAFREYAYAQNYLVGSQS